MMQENKAIVIRVKRQQRPSDRAHWEEFELRWRPYMNVIICLRDIAEKPVTRDGKKTTPIAYDSNCMEEACGSCAMLINRKALMACSTLVDSLNQPIRLEPLTKFPVVRDLIVDRSIMFEHLKRMRAWVPIDGTYNLGAGPRVSQDVQQKGYVLSRCFTCGLCLEVCPQVNKRSDYVGPAVISQVRLFNMHPTGAMHARERLEAVTGRGGIQDCGNSQNCIKVCPKHIPLTESIAEVNRQAIRQVLLGWLHGY